MNNPKVYSMVLAFRNSTYSCLASIVNQEMERHSGVVLR